MSAKRTLSLPGSTIASSALMRGKVTDRPSPVLLPKRMRIAVAAPSITSVLPSPLMSAKAQPGALSGTIDVPGQAPSMAFSHCSPFRR
jgi:hypothetical protein